MSAAICKVRQSTCLLLCEELSEAGGWGAPWSIVSAFCSFLHVSRPTQQSEVTVRVAGNTDRSTLSKPFYDSDGGVLNGAVSFKVLRRNGL